MTGHDDALDAMVKSTMKVKADKATKLTPVAGEKSLPQRIEEAPALPAPTPFADLHEVLNQIDATERGIGGLFAILRSQVRAAMPIPADPALALDEGAALAAAGVDVVAAAQRVFPDATFVEDYAAKSKAAQQATFSGSTKPGWECSQHGALSVTERTSRKGRTYLACTTCEEFEK